MCLILMVCVHEYIQQHLNIHQVPFNDTEVGVWYAIIIHRLDGYVHPEI